MVPITRLAELLEDWQYLIRRDGARSTLPAVGLEVAQLPFRHTRLLLLARSLREPMPDLHPSITLDVRPFTPTDLDLVRKIDRPSEARLCARRLASGYVGLLALHDNQPAGHAWACIKINPALERVHPRLEAGDMLCADVYTNPAYRGQGVQTALTLARFGLFRDLGYRRAISFIEMQNAPSLMVWQRKLGSVTIGQVDFLRVGLWRRVRYSLDHSPDKPGSDTRSA